jgi:hypothetical protein
MSEVAGLVYYGEVFDGATGYLAGDSIQIQFKSVKVTVGGTDHEIVGASGITFYTHIREAMRGTDSAATATALATHDGKLDAVDTLVDTLITRLTAARAGYIDNLNGHTPQTGDNYTRLGAPTAESIAADLLDINNLVDDLEGRLTAVRAGYLDQLGPTNVPADIDTLISRLTALRAGYLDNLSGGPVALAEACTEARLAILADWANDGRLDTLLDAAVAYGASSAAWGSINSGIVFRGSVSAADPGVSFTIGGLAGQGAGAFVDTGTPWYAYVFRDAGGAGAAPQGEAEEVLTYDSATGTFTTNAFTVPVDVGDNIVIMSYRIATTPDILADTTAIRAKTDTLVRNVPKNVALPEFTFGMVDANGDLVPAQTVTGQISQDHAAFGPMDNTVEEIGSGAYYVDGGLTQAEMNADCIVLLFQATGAKPRMITIITSS